MAITEYGKLVREFRDAFHVSLRQMAVEIDFSPTYLSAVEMGEKSVTEDLVHKVVGFFRKRGMKTKEIARLRAAADRTRRMVDVSRLDGRSKQAVATFARKLADLDREARELFLRQLDIATGGEDK